MKIRVLFTTALAVGAMTVACYSQEASRATTVAAAKGDDKTAGTRSQEEIETKAVAVTHSDDPFTRWLRGEGTQGVDPITTSSIAQTKAGKPAGKGGAPFGEIVARYAGEYGVPVDLAHAVIRVESNYRASARGRAGEIGLMQIKPTTARLMGYRGSAKGLYNPETNIKYGMKYLAKAHQLGGGKTCGTILKYNAGHGAKRMNKISAAYCAKVKRFIGT